MVHSSFYTDKISSIYPCTVVESSAFTGRFQHCFVFLKYSLGIFRHFKKLKTGVNNLEMERIVAFDQHLPELFSVLYFHINKSLFLTLKNH